MMDINSQGSYMIVQSSRKPFSVVVRLLPQMLIVSAAALVLGACAGGGGGGVGKLKAERPNFSPKVVEKGNTVPKGGGHYKVGRPYQIANKWYRPRVDTRYDRVGTASWYGDMFHGRKTANGEVFDMNALTAAHPTLPLPVLVQVTNLQNGRSMVVRVNDRGPYRHNRVIDLSKKTAELLGFKHKGTAKVRVKYLRKAPLSGDDSYEHRVLASKSWAPGARRNRYASNQPAESDNYSESRISTTSGRTRPIRRRERPIQSFSLGADEMLHR